MRKGQPHGQPEVRHIGGRMCVDEAVVKVMEWAKYDDMPLEEEDVRSAIYSHVLRSESYWEPTTIFTRPYVERLLKLGKTFIP